MKKIGRTLGVQLAAGLAVACAMLSVAGCGIDDSETFDPGGGKGEHAACENEGEVRFVCQGDYLYRKACQKRQLVITHSAKCAKDLACITSASEAVCLSAVTTECAFSANKKTASVATKGKVEAHLGATPRAPGSVFSSEVQCAGWQTCAVTPKGAFCTVKN